MRVIRNPSGWRSCNRLTIDNHKKVEEAHRTAFSSAQEVIDRDVVLGEKIVQLSYITNTYTKLLSKTDSNYRPIIITIQKNKI